MIAVVLAVFLLLSACAPTSTTIPPVVEPEPTPTPKLAIRNVQVCSYVSDEGDYAIQPGAIFDRGDTIEVYLEIPGVMFIPVDDGFECHLKVTELRIYDPDGYLIANKVDVADLNYPSDVPGDYIWFSLFYQSTMKDVAGEHRIEFTIRDELSGADGTGSATFILR